MCLGTRLRVEVGVEVRVVIQVGVEFGAGVRVGDGVGFRGTVRIRIRCGILTMSVQIYVEFEWALG